jgi:curved DNA-binding protein CbpA
MAKLLLRHPDINDVNAKDKLQRIPLHYAVIYNHVEVKNYSQIEVTQLRLHCKNPEFVSKFLKLSFHIYFVYDFRYDL